MKGGKADLTKVVCIYGGETKREAVLLRLIKLYLEDGERPERGRIQDGNKPEGGENPA